jgi:hypothetical protein
MRLSLVIFIPLCIGAITACTPSAISPLKPEGQEKSSKTKVLETGAAILQTDSPLDPMNIYLDGFHVAKDDPAHQMEAHHFCRQVNEDFAQCALFDGNTRQANLIGIEYIVSEVLFESLPGKEKKYWHPHNFEILSGQLIAPGIPEMAENELMKGKRGVAIFAEAFMGIPAQQAAKITRPLMPSAAPAVLLHSLHTQQGVCNIVIAMTRRDFVKPAFSLRYAP